MGQVNSIEEDIRRLRIEVSVLNTTIKLNSEVKTRRELLFSEGRLTTVVHIDMTNLLTPIQTLTSDVASRLNGMGWTYQTEIRAQPENNLLSFNIASTGSGTTIYAETTVVFPFNDLEAGNIVYLTGAEDSTNNNLYRSVSSVGSGSTLTLTTPLNKVNSADSSLVITLVSTVGW